MQNIFLLYCGFVFFSGEADSQENCDQFKWFCKNGECIDPEYICDGELNCSDGSDETFNTCSNIQCAENTFQCAYGACISWKKKCDGVKDCNDNSDETSSSCSAKKTCPVRTYQCKSGTCISLENICDGNNDCDDQSDETAALCFSITCTPPAFRCRYGACIHQYQICNGIKDCADGSDETDSLCGNKKTVPTTKSPEIKKSEAVDGCVFDSTSEVIAYYTSNSNEILKSGAIVSHFSAISYKCRTQHLLAGSTENFCDNGTWTNLHPKCTKHCDNTILKGVTFQALCEYGAIRIPCHESPLLTGTRAKISCQVGYQKPDKIVPEIIVCDDRGEWDYYPFKCEPVCGIEPTQSTIFVLGGEKINNTLVPWHVGIYFQRGGRYEQICGGTIINAKVVISAAHCFWNELEDKLHDKSLFRVYTGKYYRNYYATEEPLQTQFFLIENIIVDHGYRHAERNYENDIAVVILTEFIVFKPHIKPVCIDWQSFSNKQIRSNLNGRVAGWGKDENNQPSKELKAIDLSTVSYHQCRAKVESKYKNLVTGDKFCVESIPGEAVCEGDSGGGFAIPKPITGQNVYFLWGIVSNGLTDKENCTGEYFTAFTNIQFFKDMIVYYETSNRPY